MFTLHAKFNKILPHTLFVFQNIDIAKDYNITSHITDLRHSNGEVHSHAYQDRRKLSWYQPALSRQEMNYKNIYWFWMLYKNFI